MFAEAMHTLYEHNRLANERVFDTAQQLTQEQWLAPQTAGRGSIRDTLVHMVSSQRVWLTHWGGVLPAAEAARGSVAPEDFPDVAAVRAFFHAVDSATSAFLQDLKPAMLGELRTRTNASGAVTSLPLWQMMFTVTHHSMQHRSEVAAMLTAFNRSPGELGFLTFLPPAGSTQRR